MKGTFIRWFILTVSIVITSYLMDGIYVSGFFSAFFAAALLSSLNAILRPIIFILTLPINILSFGLFTFIINAIMLKIASGLIPGFAVYGFWTAIFGSIFISIFSWFLNLFINEQGSIHKDSYIDLKNIGDNKWE